MENKYPDNEILGRGSRRPRIGLNLIVKNESHVIEELLRSINPLIDTWTIVDTGSSDSTPELIERVMGELGKPGRLFKRPWRDFGTNRSEALELARGSADYHWVIDADDRVVGDLQFPKLSLPAYFLRYGGKFTYLRQQLFRDDLPWRYIGVLHEFPSCGQDVEVGEIKGDYFIESRRLGDRNRDPNKYLKDALVLEAGLRQEPHNTRYWFYLGQSYFDAGVFPKALDAYRRRVDMQGWIEEAAFAQLRVGLCLEKLGAPIREITADLLEAWRMRPIRAEPLYHLARILRLQGDFESATMFSRYALTIPQPPDKLFVDSDVYNFGVADEFAVSAYYTQNGAVSREGFTVCQRLAARDDLPQETKNRAVANLDWYRKKFPEG